MGNDPLDPFESQLNSLEHKFKYDLLSKIDKQRWPDRIDYVASKIAKKDRYTVGINSNSGPERIGSAADLDEAASDHYVDGIVALTGNHRFRSALPDEFRLGQLLVQFTELRRGLEKTQTDIPPGEILGRLITRNIKRTSSEDQLQAAQELHTESTTPRELLSDISSVPALAEAVDAALPSTAEGPRLTQQLAEVSLTTRLWEHQRDALEEWLRGDMNGYADMATATGKTVLGLAAVAYIVEAGSLHPADKSALESAFDEPLPKPDRNRPDDVLIVTTDDLLAVQWSRLFQEHCHTPPEYTQPEDGSIVLPWGTIDIRSASSMEETDPSEYRLAIFDEVHNYASGTGWGDILTEFIDSDCSVLALTGSVTEDFESRVHQAERPFPRLGKPYTHRKALSDGIIPNFSWTLTFTNVQENKHLRELKNGAQRIPQIVDYTNDGLKVPEPAPDSPLSGINSGMQEEIAGQYDTGSQLARTLRNLGEGPEAPTELLERIANSLSNRSVYRLNLKTESSTALEIARNALSEKRPVLILTRSYSEAKQLWQELYSSSDERLVVKIERDQSAEKQDEEIQRFDHAETSEKVLIAPGKHIGQGTDIQSVEVGINIARPSSGANTTLVQRLGRLLRKAGGKDSVEFYHLLGVQRDDSVLPPDGKSFVTNVAGFFGQSVLPDTDGILKPPSVRITSDDVARSISVLEQAGATQVASAEQSTRIETAYTEAIQSSTDEPENPVIKSNWFDEAFDVETADELGESADDHSQSRAETKTEAETTPGERAGQTGGDRTRTKPESEETETDETEKMDDNPDNSAMSDDAPDNAAQAKGHSVEIDPALIALIETIIESPESEFDSANELVNSAVRSFLKSAVVGEIDASVFETTSDRWIEFSADPTLERLLTERMKSKSSSDSINSFIKSALYSHAEINTNQDSIRIRDYAEFKLPIKAILEEDKNPCETPGDVVEAALRTYFDLRPTQ